MTETDVEPGKYTVEIKEQSPFCSGNPWHEYCIQFIHELLTTLSIKT